MFGFSPNFSNSSTGSRLYCVWVPVHENGRDRLVSIWIDPASTAFESRLQEASCGIDPAAGPFGRQEENDVDRLDAEDLHTFFRFADEKCRSARREQCFGITLQFDWA
jgi:hypothetical protein